MEVPQSACVWRYHWCVGNSGLAECAYPDLAGYCPLLHETSLFWFVNW